MHTLIQHGLIALEHGDRHQARTLFRDVLSNNYQDITAWLCMAEALDEIWQKRACLAYALQRNPAHPELAQALDTLV